MPGDFLQAERKNYFAIAFPNISGGYEVRNRFFKACISPKDITCVTNGQEMGRCYVFEGFMDYLSFEPAFPLWPKGDCLVLNSVSNLPKAFSFLSRYDDIYSCLDNDTAGNNTVMAMKENMAAVYMTFHRNMPVIRI